MLQTVRIWQGSDEGNYNCNHVLRDHNAEVNRFKITSKRSHTSHGLTSHVLKLWPILVTKFATLGR